MNYERDKQWASGYEGQALSYLRDYLFARYLRPGTQQEDTKQATDYKLQNVPGDLSIAMRVRRVSNVKTYRHFTLRLQRPSGRRTEVAKIAEGYADVYCYAWVNDLLGGKLSEYMIVDMHAFRRSGLLDDPDGENWTRDGSARFAWWKWQTLQDAHCLIEHISNVGMAVQYRTVIDPGRVPTDPA